MDNEQVEEQTQTLNKMSEEQAQTLNKISAEKLANERIAYEAKRLETHSKEEQQLIEAMKMLREMQPLPDPHIHGPFTFLLNANHNALRGCQTCGTAWVGSMAGSVEHLVWHLVQEEED